MSTTYIIRVREVGGAAASVALDLEYHDDEREIDCKIFEWGQDPDSKSPRYVRLGQPFAFVADSDDDAMAIAAQAARSIVINA